MRATAKIEDLKSLEGKHIIVRNLSRILDLRILDIDMESRTVSFVYDSILAFENAKTELQRIGFPVGQCTYEPSEKGAIQYDYEHGQVTA